MLFNSYTFIFAFLPITLVGFYLIAHSGHPRIAISWLVGASLFFYCWWNPIYLGLILSSVLFNYAISLGLASHRAGHAKRLLAFGIASNLGLLGYFKYADFFIGSANSVFATDFALQSIVLPLAISFFTFQQIAYLVDSYRRDVPEHSFIEYCLFVTFFPQLIAGPIVHHKEMMPQFARNVVYKFSHENLAVGTAIFTLGLFKKVALADNISFFATPVFQAAEQGVSLTFFEAWAGTLSYTFQIYFDFSGYSDMAIGLAWMFGIYLPLNFNSPYKATNVIMFWRRWHMTLSRFLRDYLYIPLGGNRKGSTRRYGNLVATMLLGGLWHGAAWTFIAWGALHGFYLLVNHGWHAICQNFQPGLRRSSWIGTGIARGLTFLAISTGWVFFRAESFHGASSVLKAMVGLNGVTQGFDRMFANNLTSWTYGLPLIVFLLVVVFFAPNTQQIIYRHKSAPDTYPGEITSPPPAFFRWKPSLAMAVIHILIAAVAILSVQGASEFLYFRF